MTLKQIYLLHLGFFAQIVDQNGGIVIYQKNLTLLIGFSEQFVSPFTRPEFRKWHCTTANYTTRNN